MYRQPNNENFPEFKRLLKLWLDTWDKRSNDIIITGDFNLDLIKYETHPPTAEYLDLVMSHRLIPNITKPTRIKHASATLIDHFFFKGTINQWNIDI